jgi:hypothetical protein
VPVDRGQVRQALVRQWGAIAAAIPRVDPDGPSRIEGWRNGEVIAHLALQPVLLRRFLATASDRSPEVTLSANLAGTRSLSGVIDVAARQGAARGDVGFAQAVDAVLPSLWAADLNATVTTVQGPIRLADYLATRCVEAVVHGGDLVEPVDPDPPPGGSPPTPSSGR